MDTFATAAGDRIGDWMITFSGRRFWPLDPRAEDVDFRDIGHALANLCRYNGHVRRFYSVAEHCTLLAAYFERTGRVELARQALLHDADEAYVGDMIRPLKRDIPFFSTIGERIQAEVFALAGLDWPIDEAVHHADARIIVDEARELFLPSSLQSAGWDLVGDRLLAGYDLLPVGHPPHVAERDFAVMFVRLFPNLPWTA